MLQARIESIMERLQERAILAMRAYPPVDLPEICSQRGWLPMLPSDADWPRASDGTPLHFLARVDCSELPEPGGPLPKSGIIQFFARIDEEMIWDGDASDYARVLYSATAGSREASPPADLPPIEGGHHSYDREMRLPDEPHTRIYPRWPLTFRSIRSWPIEPNLDPRSGVTPTAYREAVNRARAGEIWRTTGWPTNPLRQAQWGDYAFNQEGKRIVILPQQGLRSAEFPQAWVIAERIARALARLAYQEIEKLRKPRHTAQMARSGADPEKLLADFEIVAQQSVSWVHQSQLAGLDAPMGEPVAKEYRDWLTRLGCDDRFEIAHLVSRSVKRGMSAAVKYCGSSRKAAAVVPVGYMNYLEGEHCLT